MPTRVRIFVIVSCCGEVFLRLILFDMFNENVEQLNLQRDEKRKSNLTQDMMYDQRFILDYVCFFDAFVSS